MTFTLHTAQRCSALFAIVQMWTHPLIAHLRDNIVRLLLCVRQCNWLWMAREGEGVTMLGCRGAAGWIWRDAAGRDFLGLRSRRWRNLPDRAWLTDVV